MDLPDRVHVDEVLPHDGLQRLDEFVPTEDLVAACEAMEVETGVGLDALPDVARRVRNDLGVEPWSHALAGGTPAGILAATGGAGPDE